MLSTVAGSHGRQGRDHTDTHWTVGRADSERMLGALLPGTWHPCERMSHDQALRRLLPHVLWVQRTQSVCTAAAGHDRFGANCYRCVDWFARYVSNYPTICSADEIRTGAYRNLFHPDTLITGKDDSGSNFARGYNLVASELLDRAMNAIRRVADRCHSLRGFLVFRAIGGGTGSGLGTRIMEKLVEDFGRKMTVIEFLVYPSPT